MAFVGSVSSSNMQFWFAAFFFSCCFGAGFDLRLPYADQGYVDDDSDVMGKLASFFGGGNKKKQEEPVVEPEETKKKGGWPW